MTLRPVLLWPDPRLRGVAAPVTEFGTDLHALAADMLETMYAAPGRGLAATQIGVMQRVFVMDCTWKDGSYDPQVMVNPLIIHASDVLASFTEGCLSLPGLTASVERPAEITLHWQDLNAAPHKAVFSGFAAVCVQHELDHLDGRLCIDLLDDAARADILPALAALESGA